MNEQNKWLEQAKHDLKIAEYNFKGNFLDAGVFYCQQSVEKSLKAVYIKKFKELLKIHDLIILGRKINLPERFLEKVSELNSAYIESRYGISLEKIPAELFDKKEALEFLNLTNEILKWAENQM